MRRIRNLKDAVDWGLCTGCGACYYFCREKKIVELENRIDEGIRPKFNSSGCGSCSECLSICPGLNITCSAENGADYILNGQLLNIMEGHSRDEEIRFRASSGGLITSLALYCLEKEKMSFVLHTGMDENISWENKTVISKSREDLLKNAGSRYSPSSPCDHLEVIEKADGKCIFIGKPCDVAAISLLRKKRPELDEKLGFVLSFFCAGVPSLKGTVDLLKSMNVDFKEVKSIKYRGDGWPGNFHVIHKDKENTLSYEESWGRLAQGYRSYRCHICPDSFGSTADVTCGDAWYQFDENKINSGESIVLVRTEKGADIVRRAMETGYIDLKPSDKNNVYTSTKSLINKHREIFGRLVAMKAICIPVPEYAGYSLYKKWLGLTQERKIRSIIGSVKKLYKRKAWRRKGL